LKDFVRSHVTQVATGKIGVTYRLSVSLVNNASTVYALFGSTTGTKSTMKFPAAYQDVQKGVHIGGVKPSIIKASASAGVDSWLTISSIDGGLGNKIQSSGIDWNSWTANSPLSVPNGGVFLGDPVNAPAKGKDVVIAQVSAL